ncbi:MAG: class C sortase [Acutalibacteraceae bacterium]|nr:class C sortase [Acutalibacteraceae bacterium]
MKKHLPTILIIVVFIVGISVFLYPTVSNYLYEQNSSKAIVEHAKKMEMLTPQQIAQEKKAVQRYNISLFKNAVVLTDPFDPDAYPITDGEYDELLAFDDIIAYIEIPAINVYLPIYHGTKEETLQIGVGHLENTSLPLGGESTHTVLSAHCGLPSAKLFTDLHLLKTGNIFRIHVLDEVLSYQVYSIDVVDPDDSSSLHIQRGKDLTTLITCTPYGKNTHRLLVHGKRINENSGEMTVEPTVEKEFTWDDFAKIAAIVISAVFVLLLLASMITWLTKKRKKKN